MEASRFVKGFLERVISAWSDSYEEEDIFAGGVDGSEEEEEGEEGDEEEDGAAVLWRSLRIHSVPGSSLGTKKKNGATAAVIRAGRRTPSHHAPTHVADSGPTSSGAWPRVTHTSRKTPPRRNPMAGPSAERAYRVPM